MGDYLTGLISGIVLTYAVRLLFSAIMDAREMKRPKRRKLIYNGDWRVADVPASARIYERPGYVSIHTEGKAHFWIESGDDTRRIITTEVQE